ncbi:MAG: major facilitator superfamily domain-containing protein 1 [Deltaproteobacteria bacterium]|nr:major facilitator superfamily domain-containing protein 1 [Deltaproteobacteria bacterium]
MTDNSNLDFRARVSPVFRWLALFMMSFVVLAVYYAYDSLNPIGELLKGDLGITAAQFGMLKQSAVSIPNVIILIFGGILIDRIGSRMGGGLFAGVCLAGTILTAIGGHVESYGMMFLGRVLFGSGVEALLVAQNKIIAKWFSGKELALAFGLNLSICRLGTFFATTTMNGMTHTFKWQGALWGIAALMTVGFLVFLVYAFIDRRVERKHKFEEEKSERIDASQILGLPRSFWFITALCVTFYCAVFPFLDFAPQIFEKRFAMETEYGSPVSSLVILLTIVFTPLAGYLCDRFGRRATMMMVGAFLIVPIHLSIGFLAGGAADRPAEPLFEILGNNIYRVFPFNGIDVVPILPVMVLGLAFSLVPAAMWPSVARMVEQKRLGTAYGIMGLLQNLGLMVVSPLVGWGEMPDVASGILGPFQLSCLMLASLGFLGFVFAVLLKMADRKAAVSIEVPEKG